MIDEVNKYIYFMYGRLLYIHSLNYSIFFTISVNPFNLVY